MVYISLLANHPAEIILGAFTIVHPVYLASLVIGNTLTDFSVQSGSEFSAAYYDHNVHLLHSAKICIF